MTLEHNITAGACALMIGALSISSAQAWTWASSRSMIHMNGGKGHGWTKADGLFGVKLQAYLGDNKTGDGRVYAQSGANVKSDSHIRIRSGLRSDGESAVVPMALAREKFDGKYTVYQYRGWFAELCREVPGPNKCSDDKRYLQGQIDG